MASMIDLDVVAPEFKRGSGRAPVAFSPDTMFDCVTSVCSDTSACCPGTGFYCVTDVCSYTSSCCSDPCPVTVA